MLRPGNAGRNTAADHLTVVASTADRDVREHADVVDVTGLLDLSRWSASCTGMRVIVRRELPHPGATLDAFEVRDGFRY